MYKPITSGAVSMHWLLCKNIQNISWIKIFRLLPIAETCLSWSILLMRARPRPKIVSCMVCPLIFKTSPAIWHNYTRVFKIAIGTPLWSWIVETRFRIWAKAGFGLLKIWSWSCDRSVICVPLWSDWLWGIICATAPKHDMIRNRTTLHRCGFQGSILGCHTFQFGF